jgi:hypothetical protein
MNCPGPQNRTELLANELPWATEPYRIIGRDKKFSVRLRFRRKVRSPRTFDHRMSVSIQCKNCRSWSQLKYKAPRGDDVGMRWKESIVKNGVPLFME